MAPRLGAAASDLGGAGASAIRPERRQASSASPVAREMTPGMMNAARQPNRSISAPATSPAPATPRPPKAPLMPSARPRARALRTSQAMPTG